ncbi:DRMBL-domain-containing protein [Coniochaeta ligniaria NRRL 30616]|uniref:DRMBL-domain-containing protein n=1 Tax=Coniochaeta ligniaria NRRL 30616 TaxID=1408157 RepID=A0A1J7K5U6_9PEZI|nr:DRMBL-domain-containing protein [Coniochaeta ligniaria NRRL 30616]
MAPAKASRTPARSSAKTITTKLPASKKKPERNASILSFFKKVDEELFVGGPQNFAVEPEQNEDIYGLGDVDADEHRYNEIESPVKKRKLSPSSDETTATPEPEKAKPISTKSSKPAKKNPFNPFLDDSSDEEDGPIGPPSAQTLPICARDESTGITSRPKGTPEEARSPSGVITQGPDAVLKPTSPVKLKPGIWFKDVPPPPLKHEQTSMGDFGDFEGVDMDAFGDELDEEDDFGGEEFRERRYMEEQARLEEENGNYSCDDELGPPVTDNGSMTETCPICSGSLAGVTADEATAHVNSCLDGNPTPIPAARPATIKREDEKDEKHEVDGREMSKRFARAAVPRPAQANPIVLGENSEAGKTTSNSAFAKLMSGKAEDAAWAAAAAAETASRGKAAYQRTCPFYKIMPGFFIAVDAFRYGAVEGCKAYFLSHFHSDHYVGLTANWTHGPIYCSKVTGSLVKNQLRTAAQYVVELEFEEKVAVPDTEGVFVTMIPANHCPGSSLFLFEKTLPGGRTQRILHCGDFRACPAHIAHPQLRPETVDAITGKTRQQKIDVCYLDTTYLNPRYSFPPQENVIRACADLCVALNNSVSSGDEKEWDSLLRRREGGAPPGVDGVSKFFTSDKKPSAPPAKATTSSTSPNAFTALTAPRPPRLLIICGTYSIGKERICKAIAQALGTRIFAPPQKARIIAQLGDPDLTALLTSDPYEAQVHMQMLMEIRAETLADYLDGYRGHFSRVVGFRPSGWNYRPSPTNGGAGLDKIQGLAGAGAMGSGKNVTANLPPGSLPTVQLLHGPGWRTRFGKRDLVPQRGSGRESMCFGVPYSEHSSFRELALFVMALRIEKIVPTVNVGSEQSRKRMKGWIDRWMSERRKGGIVKVLEEDEEEGGEKRDGVKLWEGKDGKGNAAYW